MFITEYMFDTNDRVVGKSLGEIDILATKVLLFVRCACSSSSSPLNYQSFQDGR